MCSIFKENKLKKEAVVPLHKARNKNNEAKEFNIICRISRLLHHRDTIALSEVKNISQFNTES